MSCRSFCIPSHIYCNSSRLSSLLLDVLARAIQTSNPSNTILCIFSYYMKIRAQSSTKKRKAEIQQDKTIEQTSTPRVKKSYSVTKTNYLQLQLETSNKKRQCVEKNIANKDKRISQLESEVKQLQDAVIKTSKECKDIRGKYLLEKDKKQLLKVEWTSAVTLCKQMKDKCNDLMDKNQLLIASQRQWKAKFEAEERKLKQLKQLRKREKREIKELIMNMLPMLNGQSSQLGMDAEQIKKLSKMF